ncbi:hypothetical protein FN846DRAFT_212424 [Sphaerosporella brunnea]|uniref:Uncharacterized protein n=1 Tax=Sphaerosporella brunnea TaxID=1250544 RepID=A0A5J5EQ67_9PEZI|nr:hypothetical protein FN846DRAFT_212424 [Sphaerosporella brunnea]
MVYIMMADPPFIPSQRRSTRSSAWSKLVTNKRNLLEHRLSSPDSLSGPHPALLHLTTGRSGGGRDARPGMLAMHETGRGGGVPRAFRRLLIVASNIYGCAMITGLIRDAVIFYKLWVRRSGSPSGTRRPELDVLLTSAKGSGTTPLLCLPSSVGSSAANALLRALEITTALECQPLRLDEEERRKKTYHLDGPRMPTPPASSPVPSQKVHASPPRCQLPPTPQQQVRQKEMAHVALANRDSTPTERRCRDPGVVDHDVHLLVAGENAHRLCAPRTASLGPPR